jgi:hypothetical protein
MKFSYLTILLHVVVSLKLFTKDIYFSILNDKIPENFNIDNVVKRPYNTDTIILKFEKEMDLSEHNITKYSSILVTNDYYDIISTVDIKGLNLVGFENNSTKIFKGFNYHNRMFVDKGLNLFNVKYNETNSFMNLYEIYGKVNNYASDQLFRWDENTFIEFLFVYDELRGGNTLYKIFVYFSSKESNYISLFKEYRNFDNIFMYYKDSKIIVKYSKDYKGHDKEKITVKDFTQVTHLYSIDFDNSTSIFHNMMKININRSFFNTKNDFCCIFIYQYLSEDIYIEKNELINMLIDNYHNVTITASDFIDQELSADNIRPYYVGIRLCDNINRLQNITYPFHFRYQPPSYNTNHAEVIVPLPQIALAASGQGLDDYIMTFGKLNVLGKEEFFVRRNRDKTEVYNYRMMFKKEIFMKFMLLEKYQNYLHNKGNINQNIPIGKMEDLFLVAVVTTVVSFVGFIMIFYEIVKYTLRLKQHVKEE